MNNSKDLKDRILQMREENALEVSNDSLVSNKTAHKTVLDKNKTIDREASNTIKKELYNTNKNFVQKEDEAFKMLANKFNEAELLFPQSEWAPRAALLAAYSYYSQDYYYDAEYELNRFLKIYPNEKSIPYAHYLLGMVYYEKIIDEKKDLEPLMLAEKKFKFIEKNYPDTDFALDASYKLDLIQDYLASKEMYIGIHYMKKKNGLQQLIDLKT